MQRTPVLCAHGMKWSRILVTQGASLGHPSRYEPIPLVTRPSSQPMYDVGLPHTSHLQRGRPHHPSSMDLNLNIDTRLTALASNNIVIYCHLEICIFSCAPSTLSLNLKHTCMYRSPKTTWTTSFADFHPNAFFWIQLSHRSMTPL